MGRSKALLPHHDETTTFLAHLITAARAAGLERVLVVGREGDTGLVEETVRCCATFVANPEPDRGQLSSLLVALNVVEKDADAIVVLPVDAASVTADVVRTVLDRAARSDAVIVRTAHRGTHGHPVLFKREVFDELRHADPAQGARSVVHANVDRVLNVEVDDPSIVMDVDTPADYERLFRRSVGYH